ncbi:MAG: hypothetical protein ACF8R7_15380 [Phycisphaerales bacterium JB039]
MSRTSRIAIVMLGVCAAASLTGCASRHARIRANPTPELHTLTGRYVDQQNDFAIMWDENVRMLRQDWDRFWYVDRPSRLTPEPIAR